MAKGKRRPRPEQVYQEGRRHIQQGRYGQAIKAFKELGEAGRPFLGEAYFRRGVLTANFADLDQAARLVPDDPRPRLWRVLLLVRAGRIGEAAQLVLRSPEDYPDPLRQLMRAVEGKEGERKVMLRAIAELSHRLPPVGEVAGWRGWVGQLTMAALRLALGQGAAELPELPKAAPRLARILHLLYRGAWRGELEAREVEVLLPSLGALPESVLQLARALLRRSLPGLLERGEVAAAEAILRAGDEFLSAEEKAAVAVKLGEAAWAQENAAVALRHWQAAREVYDLDQALALALEKDGRPKEAMRLWERVLRREERAGGDLRQVYLELSRVAEEAEEEEKAILYGRRALAEGEPEDPWAYERLARLLEEAGGPKEEVVDLRRRYLRRVPKDAEVRKLLVADLLELEDAAGAAAVLSEGAGEMDEEEELESWSLVLGQALESMPRRPFLRELLPQVRERLEELWQGFSLPWEAHLALWDGDPERARRLLEAAPSWHDEAYALGLFLAEAFAWFRLGETARGRRIVEEVADGFPADVAAALFWYAGSAFCASRMLAGGPCREGCPEVEELLEESQSLASPLPPTVARQFPAASRCPGFRRLRNRILRDVLDKGALEALVEGIAEDLGLNLEE